MAYEHLHLEREASVNERHKRRCVPPQAIHDAAEPYALAVVLADREQERAQLYAEVRAELRARAQARARARIRA